MQNVRHKKDNHGLLFRPFVTFTRLQPQGPCRQMPVLSRIIVRPRPGRKSQGLLAFAGNVVPCALGKGGISALKREGDGATPLAAMRVLSARLRPGRLMPVPKLLPSAMTRAT